MPLNVEDNNSFFEGLIANYSTNNSAAHTEFDSEWLEETHAGFLGADILNAVLREDPKALRDKDLDGYVEISKTLLQKVLEGNSNLEQKVSKNRLALAPFFDDRSADVIKREMEKEIVTELRCAMPYSGLSCFYNFAPKISDRVSDNVHDKTENKDIDERTKYIPEDLKPAVINHDLTSARSFFTRLYKEMGASGDPLEKISRPLAAYLAGSLVHPGMDWAGDITDVTIGLSVHKSGRLRADCEGHAQLAHSALKDIPGIEFNFVILSREETETVPSKIGDFPARSYMREHNIEHLECEEIRIFDLYRNFSTVYDHTKNHYVNKEGFQRGPKGVTPLRVEGEGEWKHVGKVVSCSKPISPNWQNDGLPDRENPTDLMVPDKHALSLRTYLGGHENVYLIPENKGDLQYEHVGDEMAYLTVNHETVYEVFYPNEGETCNPFANSPDSADKSIFFMTPQPAAVDDAAAHMISVAHLPGQGYIVQDNHIIKYVETDDIWSWIKNEYKDNFKSFSRRPTPHDENNTVNW